MAHFFWFYLFAEIEKTTIQIITILISCIWRINRAPINNSVIFVRFDFFITALVSSRIVTTSKEVGENCNLMVITILAG